MKLRAPHFASGPISHKGVSYDISAEGLVEVSDQDAQALLAHGCLPIREAGDPELGVKQMTRSALVMRVMDLTLATLKGLSTEAIRARLLALQKNSARASREIEAAGDLIDADCVCADDIETMNRPALFAFLREKGITVAIPIRNEELREMARNARPGDA